jgi:hypothetical protein
MALISTKRIYQCDNCGTQGEWGKSWLTKTYLHMKGQWDEVITVCSPECAENIDRKRAKGSARKKYKETINE